MIGRARLPTPPEVYDPLWAMQFHRALDQNLDRAFEGSPNFAPASGYYGSFYDTTTQTAAAVNTPYAMKFNNTAEANQTAIVDLTKLTFKNRGTYNIQFSAQLDKASGAQAYIWIWFRLNGVDIANSASKYSISGTVAENIAALNFFVTVKALDYVELMWATDDTNTILLAEPSNAFHPGIPSVILTAQSI
jgi:hypothetical protein